MFAKTKIFLNMFGKFQLIFAVCENKKAFFGSTLAVGEEIVFNVPRWLFILCINCKYGCGWMAAFSFASMLVQGSPGAFSYC
jgi:hypothetical protein